MKIIFFTHPLFLSHQSMPRYARWLAEGMKKRGHTIELWTAKPLFYKLPCPRKLKKWLGYIDQYIVFPIQIKQRLNQYKDSSLFVFTDHALGPWVPLVSGYKHVVHCHDFLAQKSALGNIPQNVTGWSGKKYQSYIHNGYIQASNFISISYKTKEDLHGLIPNTPETSEVVYNGVNPFYKPIDKDAALSHLSNFVDTTLSKGFILHVGGNQWYKNRIGVINLYCEWRTLYERDIPLLMIGETPSPDLEVFINSSKYKSDIFFLSGMSDKELLSAYSVASLFLFPSLAEGFGWPIAEAMACGCIVITTNEAPMTEVGGDAAFYVQPMPISKTEQKEWLTESTEVIEQVIRLNDEEKHLIINKGFKNIERFDSEKALDKMQSIYIKINENYSGSK